MKALIPALAVIVLFTVIQCGGPSPTSPATVSVKDDPSFSTDVLAIINTAGCARAGCHDLATSQAGLRLMADSAYSNLVNVFSTEVPSKKRVAPGDPVASYLIDKLQGTAAVGVQMPATGQALSAGDITTITNWILKGAKNN